MESEVQAGKHTQLGMLTVCIPGLDIPIADTESLDGASGHRGPTEPNDWQEFY